MYKCYFYFKGEVDLVIVFCFYCDYFILKFWFVQVLILRILDLVKS